MTLRKPEIPHPRINFQSPRLVNVSNASKRPKSGSKPKFSFVSVQNSNVLDLEGHIKLVTWKMYGKTGIRKARG